MGERPECPHCGMPVDMTDSDIYCQHTTYWGEDGPKPHTCWHCNGEMLIDEIVNRQWLILAPPAQEPT